MGKQKSRKKRRVRLNIHGLIDNAKCYQMVRRLRWPEGVECPHCHDNHIVKNGHDPVQTDCQHYLCRDCGKTFGDLTKTVFAGHHQPLSIWMLCLYLMGLNFPVYHALLVILSILPPSTLRFQVSDVGPSLLF